MFSNNHKVLGFIEDPVFFVGAKKIKEIVKAFIVGE